MMMTKKIALILAGAALGTATVVAEQPGVHIRTISVSAKPIVDRLLPDDEVVLIKYEWDVVVTAAGAASAQQTIDDATSQADAVAIVGVTDVSGFLAYDDVWINTRVIGTVREVVRSSQRADLRPGQTIEVEHPDGQLNIGKVLVMVNEGSPIRPHRSYLMFLTAGDPPSTVLTPVLTPLAIEHGELRNPLKADGVVVSDPLDGWSLKKAIEQIKHAE